MLRTMSWALVTVLALAMSAAGAKPPAPPASAASVVRPVAAAPAESQLVEHGQYINGSGAVVHSPACTISGQAPAGASAQCRDGTFSFS